MKTEELMIGDWVKINDVDYNDPVQVAQITRKSGEFYIGFGYNGDMILCVGEKIEPVPLTREILKTNGWKVGSYSKLKLSYCKWLEYYHYEHRLVMWWKGVDEWENHSEQKELCFQCECHYVHQLQHALRLCGSLNDLADNFKIKADEE